MCEANAYVIKDGGEQLLLESVDLVEPEDPNGFRLVSIFGEQKIIRGRLKGMNLVNHKIFFEEGEIDHPTGAFCSAQSGTRRDAGTHGGGGRALEWVGNGPGDPDGRR